MSRTPDTSPPDSGRPPASPGAGEHESRLAVGSLAQIVAQVVAVLTMLVVFTALGRTLTLDEFGVYGLALSFSLYFLFVQGSVETAGIKALAEATDDAGRNRAFSTAMTVYAAAGAGAGVLIIAAGIGILQLFDIPAELLDQARLGVIAIGVTTFVGWPIKTYTDVLRGTQRFVAAATAEIIAYLLLSTTMMLLLFVFDAPLWILVGVAGSIPLLIGAVSSVIVLATGLPFRYRFSSLERDFTRQFASFAFYVFASSASDLVVYSMDRAVLAAFRPASAVGLYEAAARPHNLMRQVQGSLGQIIFPASAAYLAENDDLRVRELLVRGTRYILAAIVPLVVIVMTLAQPLLIAWLGPTFSGAATATTIFISYWLINASTSVAGTMLTAAGRVRAIAALAWGVALVNAAVSLALTPSLGLVGVVTGTTAAYVAAAPVLLWLTFTTLPVTIGEFARRTWLPAYTTGLGLAAILLVLRFTVGLESVAELLAAGIGGALAYWAFFYAVWTDAGERLLLRSLLRRGKPPTEPLPPVL